jgi:hypothetical protein
VNRTYPGSLELATRPHGAGNEVCVGWYGGGRSSNAEAAVASWLADYEADSARRITGRCARTRRLCHEPFAHCRRRRVRSREGGKVCGKVYVDMRK